MSQTINLDAGGKEYVDPPELLTANHDISAATVELGLGGLSEDDPPLQWLASNDPAALVSRPAANQVQATLLIGDTVRPAAGVYRLWSRLADTTEILAHPFTQSRVVVINTGSVTYPA